MEEAKKNEISDNKTISYTEGKGNKMVSISFIRNFIAQVLQVENLNFFIGAGCSSHIENKQEIGIPKMKFMYEDFFDKNQDFEIAKKDVKEQFDYNLEKMLEVMNSISVTNTIFNVDSKIDDKIHLVQKFIRQTIIDKLHVEKIKNYYKNFYSKISQKNRINPINIFTTNYDLYNEMALDELGFLYNSGFSGTYKRKFNPNSYNYTYVENMSINRDIWEQISTFYNLIKLHGSISWLRENNNIWETDYDKIEDKNTTMIYPTPLKDRSTLMVPYSDLFRIMENKIMKKNSTLIVLGYSFGDAHINRIIMNALSNTTFKLIIFGKSDEIEKLKKYADNRIVIINSNDKIHYFKSFIENILPNIHPDVEEKLNFNKQNEEIIENE